MFIKLKHTFNPPEFKKLYSYVRYGETINDIFMGLDYSTVDIEQSEKIKILNIIPKIYQNKIEISLISINSRLPPHTDSMVKTVINYYIEGANYTTNFYRLRDNPKTYQIKNQSTGYIYTQDSVELVNSFCANSGDVYLLDVSKPHSVEPESSSTTIRTAFNLSTCVFTFFIM